MDPKSRLKICSKNTMGVKKKKSKALRGLRVRKGEFELPMKNLKLVGKTDQDVFSLLTDTNDSSDKVATGHL